MQLYCKIMETKNLKRLNEATMSKQILPMERNVIQKRLAVSSLEDNCPTRLGWFHFGCWMGVVPQHNHASFGHRDERLKFQRGMYKPWIWHATSQRSHFDKWCTPTCSLNQISKLIKFNQVTTRIKTMTIQKSRRSGFGFTAPTAASKAQFLGKQTTTFLLSQFLTRADPSSWDRPGWAKKVAGKSSAPRWPVLKMVKCDEFSMWDLGEVGITVRWLQLLTANLWPF